MGAERAWTAAVALVAELDATEAVSRLLSRYSRTLRTQEKRDRVAAGTNTKS